MAIVYRASSGSDLDADQIDGNFHNLDDRVAAVEGAIPSAAVGIASIAQAFDGAPLDITLTNATVLHFTLPRPVVRFLPWQPITYYTAGQFLIGPGETAIYEVALSHISAPAFDPGANEGSAGDIYELLLSINSLPTDIVAPHDGDILRYRVDSWRNEPPGSLFTSFPVFTASITSAGTWSPSISAGFKTWVFDDACAIVLPTNGDVPMAVGTELAFFVDTDGDVTVEGAMIDTSSDVAVKFHASFSAKGLGRNVFLFVKKLAANTWALTGTLAGA